jgi:hypothetical protein
VYLKVLTALGVDCWCAFVLSIANTLHLPGCAPLKSKEKAVVLTIVFWTVCQMLLLKIWRSWQQSTVTTYPVAPATGFKANVVLRG